LKIADIKANAFAMPFVSPSYSKGPYHFVNREFLIISYRTDAKKLREMVPEPLTIDDPIVSYEFIRMPDSSGFGDYTESGQVISVIDILVANAGIQIVHPIEDFPFADWKKIIAIHLDGSFLTTKAAIKHMYAGGKGGSIIYMGSVHSHEASRLKAAYVAAKHGILGLARVVAKEGGPKGVRANVVCPGFVRTPLVNKQIPEQAAALKITEAEVIKNVMLKDTVDGEFTTTEDVANVVAFLAGFESSALTGQSVVVSHGWSMH